MARRSTPQYRGTLAKSLYRNAAKPDELDTILWEALYADFGIPPDAPDAKDRVRWALAFRHVPALRLPPQVFGGKGSYQATVKIMRAKDQRRPRVELSVIHRTVSEYKQTNVGSILGACKRLSRLRKLNGGQNPLYKVDPGALVRSYHAFQVSLLGRFSLTDPARLCARRESGPCLTRAELEELDITSAYTACKMGEGCKFREAAITAFNQLLYETDKERTRLANLKRLIELRDWAWPANPNARKGK